MLLCVVRYAEDKSLNKGRLTVLTQYLQSQDFNWSMDNTDLDLLDLDLSVTPCLWSRWTSTVLLSSVHSTEQSTLYT